MVDRPASGALAAGSVDVLEEREPAMLRVAMPGHIANLAPRARAGDCAHFSVRHVNQPVNRLDRRFIAPAAARAA